MSHATEQLAGLRRLLSRRFVRTVTLCGGKPGIGRTAVLTNIAVFLARQGRSVLLLDQNGGKACATALLGLSPGRDLADVLERNIPLDEVLLHGPEGLRVLRAVRSRNLIGSLTPSAEERLSRSLEQIVPRLDYVLIDAPSGEVVQMPSLSLASQEVVVMVSPHNESITTAYALIRRLSWELARRRFHILANGVRSSAQGRVLFENLALAARSLLSVQLEYLGCVPEDDALRKACRLRAPVARLFPGSDAAVACAMVADTIDQWPYPGEDCLDGFVQRLLRSARPAAFSG